MRLAEAFAREVEHDRRYRPLAGGGSRAKKIRLSGNSREPDEDWDDNPEEVMAGLTPSLDEYL